MKKKRACLHLFDKETGELTLLSPEWMNISVFDYDSKRDHVDFFGNDYQWADPYVYRSENAGLSHPTVPVPRGES